MSNNKRKEMWELRQSADPGTLELYIYGDVEGDYFDWWEGRVVESETSADHFRGVLAEHSGVTQIQKYKARRSAAIAAGIWTEEERQKSKKIFKF